MINHLDNWIYETTFNTWLNYLNIWFKDDMKNNTKLYYSALSDYARWQSIIDNPNIPWAWRNISKRKDITWDMIINNPGYPWNWYRISQNPNITWDIIINNLDYPWNWDSVAMNINITYDIIKSNQEFPPRPGWKNVNDSNVGDWPVGPIPWKWVYISQNPNLTQQIIEENIGENWHWYFISMNPKIISTRFIENSTKMILCNDEDKVYESKMLIDWNGVSQNPNLTMDILDKYNHFKIACIDYSSSYSIDNNIHQPKFKWNWISVSRNNSISWKYIQSNLYCPWYWNHVLKNPNITWDDALEMAKYAEGLYEKSNSILRFPYYWIEYYSSNPNILWDKVVVNTTNFNRFDVLENTFDKQLDLIKQDCIIKWNAVNKIRKWWLFKIYLNPFHRVGAKRLERSYLEFALEDNN